MLGGRFPSLSTLTFAPSLKTLTVRTANDYLSVTALTSQITNGLGNLQGSTGLEASLSETYQQ